MVTNMLDRPAGFSAEAWASFSEVVGENHDLENEVSTLRDIARRSAVLVRWFSREDWPYVEFSGEESSAMNRDAKSLTDALERAKHYAEGWGG